MVKEYGFVWVEDELENLKDAMVQGESIVISGQTATGKSTLLKSLLDNLPNTGVIQIYGEDKRESGKEIKNGLGVESWEGEKIPRDKLLEGLRKQVKWLVYEECNTSGEFTKLAEAAQSGHNVITEIHASSPEDTLQRMLNLFNDGSEEAKRNLVEGKIFGKVVHLKRELGDDGIEVYKATVSNVSDLK